MTWIVDVVAQGVGTTGTIGPFRSYDRARKMVLRLVRQINRDEGEGTASFEDVTAEVVLEIVELVAPSSWREVVPR